MTTQIPPVVSTRIAISDRPISRTARDEIQALVSESLRDVAYTCGRAWEAWQYGTMTQDDFSPAWEDDELVGSMADALILAGYVKSQLVTTAEEVRCLPSGSFFTDSNGRGYIAMGNGPRRGYFGENAPEDGWAIPDLTSLPFTVQFIPPYA